VVEFFSLLMMVMYNLPDEIKEYTLAGVMTGLASISGLAKPFFP
jgi:hypothetical protein